MNSTGAADLLVAARIALLDALGALHVHRRSVIVIGAQAIYLHTGAAAVALAEATKDSDLALDPRTMFDEPLLQNVMTVAGFRSDPHSPQPGSWLHPNGVPVDLMVPEALAGGAGRRGARIPPHSNRAARRAAGLEAALVDNGPVLVTALTAGDDRACMANVAGPAALLVAKLHGPASAQGLTYLDELFACGPAAPGSMMAGRAEEGVGDPLNVAASAAALAEELLRVINSQEG